MARNKFHPLHHRSENIGPKMVFAYQRFYFPFGQACIPLPHD